MVHFSDEFLLGQIELGTVLYFVEETFSSSEPHYFIVINKSPVKDKIVLLVCSSSRIESVKRRRTTTGKNTLVEISKNEYEDFSKDSIVDCNKVFSKSPGQVIRKLKNKELKFKTLMKERVVEKLRIAVLNSPLVEYEIKEILLSDLKSR